jgi:hypothetical protein
MLPLGVPLHRATSFRNRIVMQRTSGDLMQNKNAASEENKDHPLAPESVNRLLVAAGLLVLFAKLLFSDRRAPSAGVDPPSAETPTEAAPEAPATLPEADKLMLDHKLQVRRLWLDRCLIGLLLVVAGLGANWFIERYKGKVTENQFYLTKRLETATVISKGFADVTPPLYKITEAACHRRDEPKSAQSELDSALDRVVNTIDASGLLLDAEYNLIAERAIRILDGAANSDCYASCDVSRFIAQLGQFMTDATRQQITPNDAVSRIARPGKTLPPLPWPIKDIDRAGNKQYFARNLESWIENEAKEQKPREFHLSLLKEKETAKDGPGNPLPPIAKQQICRKKSAA